MTSALTIKEKTKVSSKFSTVVIAGVLGLFSFGSAIANTEDIYNPLEQQLNNLMLEESEDEKAAILELGSEATISASLTTNLKVAGGGTVTNAVGTALISDVALTDSALQSCVSAAASSMDWTLVSQVTELRCNDKEITDLQGIEQFSALFFLSLNNNLIIDVLPLNSLPRLHYLYMNNNQIDDIAALQSLTNLLTLHLDNNQISDLAALSAMTQLQQLYLSVNQISDLTPLSKLQQMQ